MSRQFSSKFHAFCNTIIIKGEVLGTVDHFYWKKEYQTHAAPHYHVLLWIRDAPMIGRDDPSKVLAWIEERITCHIPDQENNPELHNLVTRYQLHKCSNYCKRKRKGGKTFVTTCKFGVHCVEEKLKKRQKIYQISQWIDVSMPHKRNRRLKDHSKLLEMESTDPDSENLFKENLYSHYYPGRPEELQDLCLDDFVANFDWYGKDSKGQRKYRKLGKPRLVNHKFFYPEKEDHREDYFYSLILLFVPVRDEASLLNSNETAEEAFQRLLPASEDCQNYHLHLLKAKANLKAIREARQTDGKEEAVVEKQMTLSYPVKPSLQ